MDRLAQLSGTLNIGFLPKLLLLDATDERIAAGFQAERAADLCVVAGRLRCRCATE